jgi:hypothetical protein
MKSDGRRRPKVMSAITNLENIIRSNANESVKLTREIAKIHAVEIDSIQVWTSPTSEKTGEYSSVEFTAIHAKFTWHGHKIVINENFDGKLLVDYDEQRIGEIFWSSMWGKLETIPNIELTLTKAQEYILDRLWRAVYHISAKGRPYEKVALTKAITYDGYHIHAIGAVIYAEKNGETIRVMGNTWRGLLWTACDSKMTEIQKVIKKAFTIY